MSEIKQDLHYTENHEWLEQQDDGSWRVGITDHAQAQLGELVFAELPEVGADVGQGEAVAVVESVKAASDIYAPVSGEISAINSDLEDSPDLVNTDCYGDGWLFAINVADDSELEDLLDAEAYAEYLDE
ncbi:MAG: glycine cleavage system protein GcvH [Gammaproteobacteria bacterium]|jgi:glycine cleavage system H protein|nr:glycine cleavage system protein GcvH [Gammaproteobacteria bacterium]